MDIVEKDGKEFSHRRFQRWPTEVLRGEIASSFVVALSLQSRTNGGEISFHIVRPEQIVRREDLHQFVLDALKMFTLNTGRQSGVEIFVEHLFDFEEEKERSDQTSSFEPSLHLTETFDQTETIRSRIEQLQMIDQLEVLHQMDVQFDLSNAAFQLFVQWTMFVTIEDIPSMVTVVRADQGQMM